MILKTLPIGIKLSLQSISQNKIHSNVCFGGNVVQEDKFERTTNDTHLESSIQRAFGKNDIRGIYGKDVTEELFFHTGKGYINYLLAEINKNS